MGAILKPKRYSDSDTILRIMTLLFFLTVEDRVCKDMFAIPNNINLRIKPYFRPDRQTLVKIKGIFDSYTILNIALCLKRNRLTLEVTQSIFYKMYCNNN